MTRAIYLTCLSLLLLGLGGTAAFAKPSIAILGIEVIDKSGAPTATDTQVAQELTQGLRSRAKAGTGPYQIAVGSDKELIDEKLIKNCDDEKPACMAAIGGELGAEFLMYGHIDKQGGAYNVSVVLLDVKRKVKEKTFPDSIPLTEAMGAALQGRAKKIYAMLTGQNDGCVIAVKTTGGVDRGTILIDGEAKGNITNGVGQVSGLTEGKYKIAVEAQDFHRWEKPDVTCTAGQTTSLAADMQKTPGEGGIGPVGPGGLGSGLGSGSGSDTHEVTGTVSHAPSSWRPIAIGGAVATGVLAVGFGVTWSMLSGTGKKPNEGAFQYGEYCKQSGTTITPTMGASQFACDHGGGLKTATYITGFAAIAAGGLTLFALIKTVSGPAKEEHAANGSRVNKPAVVVTPIVSPDGAGATLQFDW